MTRRLSQAGDGNAKGSDEEGPACQSCRKRKAKCSRKQPCSQCVRFKVECLYDDTKLKPGLRTGVVDNLSQRVETLENMFLGQSMMWQELWGHLRPPSSEVGHRENVTPPADNETLLERKQRSKAVLSQLATRAKDDQDELGLGERRSPKRRRVENESVGLEPKELTPLSLEESSCQLPPDGIVDELVDFYFLNIHHWIPILHVMDFRERLRVPEQRLKLANVLHAIVCTCSRFLPSMRHDGERSVRWDPARSRRHVILESMESFSVENLQALVIIAFDTVGASRVSF